MLNSTTRKKYDSYCFQDYVSNCFLIYNSKNIGLRNQFTQLVECYMRVLGYEIYICIVIRIHKLHRMKQLINHLLRDVGDISEISLEDVLELIKGLRWLNGRYCGYWQMHGLHLSLRDYDIFLSFSYKRCPNGGAILLHRSSHPNQSSLRLTQLFGAFLTLILHK